MSHVHQGQLPVVQVGQVINIEWKDEVTKIRSNRGAEIIGIKKKSKLSKGSWYKYTLVLDTGETVATRLLHCNWSLQVVQKVKVNIPRPQKVHVAVVSPARDTDDRDEIVGRVVDLFEEKANEFIEFERYFLYIFLSISSLPYITHDEMCNCML